MAKLRYPGEFSRFFTILFLSVFQAVVVAQPDSTAGPGRGHGYCMGIQAMYQNGYVFATNKFMKGVNAESVKINAFQAFSLKFAIQTTGKEPWEQSYKYPQYGIGLYAADFFRHKEIGVPFGLYGFFNAPFSRWNRLVFNYELGFGATFNWKSYNPVTNRYNVAIGAGESFLIDAGLNLQYLLADRIELQLGISLTHFSNGALKEPNFGFNTLAPKLSIRYNFYDRPHFTRHQIPPCHKHNEWIFAFYGGAKNVIFDTLNLALLEKYEGIYFPVFGISATFNRRLNYKSKIGIGMTISYNGAANAQAAVELGELDADGGRFGDKIMVSIYPSYELVIHKAAILIQPAFYVYRKKLVTQSPVFHQRIGFKYHLTDHLFMGITLVAYKFHVSDFIEWSAGCNLNMK
ncbi:MAG: acyloxyacyl hydrolase [Bacteroidota bacterium]